MKKPATIGKKPTAAATAADEWIAQGAEVQTPAVKPKESNPRRMTIDMSDDLHKAIKLASVNSGTTMVDLVRGVLAEHFMKD